MSATINWQKLLPNDGSKVATACIGLLNQLWSGKMSQTDFEKETYYVAIGYPGVLEALRPRISPSSPAAYSEMVDRRSKDKEKFDATGYVKDHPEIADYLNKESEVTWVNKSNAEWLEELYEFFSQLGDLTSAVKVRTVYDEYPRTIYDGSNKVWMKRPL